MEACGVSRERARAAIEAADRSVKVAIVMVRAGVERDGGAAAARARAGGLVRNAVGDPPPVSHGRVSEHLAVGLMSGTSLDGVSTALVRLDAEAHARRSSWHSGRSPTRRRSAVRSSTRSRAAARRSWPCCTWRWPSASPARRCSSWPRRRCRPRDLSFVASHGQTVWHEPGRATLQLGRPRRAGRAPRRPGGERLPLARRGGGRAGRSARAARRRDAVRSPRARASAPESGRHGERHLGAAARRDARARWRSTRARASR